MVKFWEEAIIKNIKLTKIIIKHCESHGIGKAAMQAKENLRQTEQKLIKWKDKNK